ncbi:oligosaccharide flippase family protein [Sulfitobacter sp. SBS6]|uniref:oligosaccharide flippase family protein n=1 Tax=Sulfitobacter sp. SBS6 TaxID=3401755 RepID=UPI003AAED954
MIALVSIVMRVYQVIATFCAAVLFAKVLEPEGFGHYSVTLSISTIVAIPILIGMNNWFTRSFKEQAYSNYHNVGEVVHIGFKLIAFYLGTVLIALIAVGFLLYMLDYIDRGKYLLLSCMMIPFIALSGPISGALLGLERPIQSQLAEYVVRPTAVLAIAVSFWFKIAYPTWELAIFLCAIAGLVSLVVPLLLLVRTGRLTVRKFSGSLKPHARAVSLLGAASGLIVFNRQIDTVLLGFMVDATDAGIYRAASQSAVLITFGSQTVSTLYSTRLVPSKSETKKKTQEYLTEAKKMSLLVAVSGLIFFLLFGSFFLEYMFGPQYKLGYLPLVILGGANCFVAYNGAIGQYFLMRGQEAIIVRVFCKATIANLILCPILIYLFGMHGAVSATAITICVWAILTQVEFLKYQRRIFL